MAVIENAIPELDAAGLRRFAVSTAGVLAGLFGLLLPWLLGRSLPWWPFALGAVLGLWGLVAPASLRPVYRAWMRFGLVMNRIMNPLVLGLVYFIAFTPIALFMKLIRRDTMARRFDPAAPTYRVASARRGREHLRKPF